MSNWEEKFKATPEYLFGTRPNRFLVENLAQLPPGKVLCLGEGEGRNAVYLAQHGLEVTAVDLAPTALAKTRRLAQQNGVHVHTILADLNDFPIAPGMWQTILCFFVHLPEEERALLHRRVVQGLAPGGVYLLEGFAPGQVRYGDRGPKNPLQLYDIMAMRKELAGLQIRIARELDRPLDDTQPELGLCAVTQVLAVKDA